MLSSNTNNNNNNGVDPNSQAENGGSAVSHRRPPTHQPQPRSSASLTNNPLRVTDRMRRKATQALKSDTARIEARQAILELVKQSRYASLALPTASTTSLHNNNNGAVRNLGFSVMGGGDDDDDDQETARASMRGAQRGSLELNEANYYDGTQIISGGLSGDNIIPMNHRETGDRDTWSGFDLDTIGEHSSGMVGNNYGDDKTDTTKTSWRKKHGGLLPGVRRRSSPDSTSSIFVDVGDVSSSCHAWMCGVCGMAFSTASTCERHEQQHIRTVVAGMEWTTTATTIPTSDQVVGPVPQSQFLNAAPEGDRNDTMKNHTQHGDTGYSQANTTSIAVQQIGSSSDDPNPDEEKIPELDDGYPGLEADLPPGALVPKPRGVNGVGTSGVGEVRFAEDALLGTKRAINTQFANEDESDVLLLSNDMKDYVVLADQALLDVLKQAEPMILTRREIEAERELALLARDKAFYDDIQQRAAARRVNPSNRFRSDRKDTIGKVQNKLLDAYQLIKESDGIKGMTDQYNRKSKSGEEALRSITDTDQTLYVNVMVKNSVRVVRHELERLAKQRWEVAEQAENFTRFERFRVYTQTNVVKLASIALASDFTPRRIAVQLSNDLYRLLTPRLKRRGVTIETEIEYRVGPYFVLAVNIMTIDWKKLIRATHRDVAQRNARWRKEHKEDEDPEAPRKKYVRRKLDYLKACYDISLFDAIAYTLSFLYQFHLIVYLPICWLAYRTILGPPLRQFILASVADEIFFYVEQKGMSMDIKVCRTEKQAAFMLSALREIRADGQELKKKREQSETLDKGPVLGPLMGPAISADKSPAPEIPPGFSIPENLEYVGLELDLPVGYKRMRWAFMSQKSEFVTKALYEAECRYDQIILGSWNKCGDHIGEPNLPDSVDESDFIGAEKEGEYLMPKSAFVSANMSYEHHCILAYNDYCFCLKKRAKNPDAPFGKSFIAWTQYLIVNTGNNTCRLTCSVEPEYPNGEPMVSRQIRGGMRAGTGELFVTIGETVAKYADEFP